ncbi:MAG: quinol:electron acceptor oxidoreductase subunit ActD [Ignavibacteriaceae bacterium]
MSNEKKLYGVAALFDSPDQIMNAAKTAAGEGYTDFDVNTPYPLHGMDRAMKLKPTKLGFVTLFAGLSGTAFILLFMFWTMSVDYPMVIGGKPFFALPAFVPITFEVTVLLGALSTVFGMLAAFFFLPDNNHPLHDTEYMKGVSADKYGLVIEASNKNFNENKVIDFLNSMGAAKVELIYYPEKVKFPVLEPKFITLLLITAVVVSVGTYVTLNIIVYTDPFDWMEWQDKTSAQEKSVYFTDEFGMRKPVQGSVARGFIPYPYMGEPVPTEVLVNPLLVTKENLDLGKRKYLTYCSPCHGDYAEGDSRLRGQFPNPPTLHSDRARQMSDGMLYHIMTNGQNIMPSYASQVTRDERWAIVNYIRVLQRAKNATEADLTAVKSDTTLQKGGGNVQN